MRCLEVLIGLSLLTQLAEAQTAGTLAVNQPIRVRVTPNEPTTVDLTGDTNGGQYLVVLESLSVSELPSPVVLELNPTATAEPVEPVTTNPPAWWIDQVQRYREKMARRRQQADKATNVHAAGKFPERKTFHLFIKEDGFHQAENYQEVTAQLAAVGKHCLVYVDLDDRPAEFPRETIDDIVSTYDERVLPMARSIFGHHLDVDRNGKFTILLTHWLGHLSSGKVSLGGFVRGGDFYRNTPAPFSNQCDMMYLNSELRAGEHLRSLIAHEYVHGITFSEHVFGDYLAGSGHDDEESWLNEAISHLAENLIGEGWSNLDYRVSTYLTNPQQYRLVVPDYYRAGLWRCHGCRGATFLFLRFIVDRYGVEVLKDLVQSNLTGIANLETATQTPFADLFHEWAMSMCLPQEPTTKAPLPALDLRDRLESRLLAGPCLSAIKPGKSLTTLAPTSFAPMVVKVSPNEVRRLKVHAPADVRLQVALVRLPADLPTVEMIAKVDASADEQASRLLLTVKHQAGADVTWQSLTWERASLPQTKVPGAQQAAIVPAQNYFTDPATTAGGMLVSQWIEPGRPDLDQLVFKLVGVDRLGRRVAAWSRLAP